MKVLPIRKPRISPRGLRRPAWRNGLDWLVVIVLFGICGLLVARLDRVQTRTFAGIASVIDGDTLDLAGERVRLRGIDAFERGQTCWRAGAQYDCGAEARARLVNLSAGRRLSCGGRTFDRYRRLVATCEAGGTNLNAAMVDAGWAIAYGDYDGEERRARGAKRGAWAGTFDEPADWRAKRGGQVEWSHDWVTHLFDLLRQLLWDGLGKRGE
jgi:endonuclease YncB( thermonuclease family)